MIDDCERSHSEWISPEFCFFFFYVCSKMMHLIYDKVADFGLSKEDIYDGGKSGLKGTYGYMDPDYMSTNKFQRRATYIVLAL